MGLFSFLFGKDEMGDDNRDYVAKNCKEGVDPRSAITDWGNYDSDFSEDHHDRSNGKAENRDNDGVGMPTREETDRYYDSTRSTDIKITRRED
jgi:hypothetical protein